MNDKMSSDQPHLSFCMFAVDDELLKSLYNLYKYWYSLNDSMDNLAIVKIRSESMQVDGNMEYYTQQIIIGGIILASSHVSLTSLNY